MFLQPGPMPLCVSLLQGFVGATVYRPSATVYKASHVCFVWFTQLASLAFLSAVIQPLFERSLKTLETLNPKPYTNPINPKPYINPKP